jgi:hypothetical protein
LQVFLKPLSDVAVKKGHRPILQSASSDFHRNQKCEECGAGKPHSGTEGREPVALTVFVYQIERPPEMGLLKDFAAQTPLFPLPYGG